MSVNAIITKALKDFGCPCKPGLYEGSEKKYFTFNYADERGADFGDNKPGCIQVDVQIHFFLPLKENYLQEKKQVREALFAAGFTFPAVMELIEAEHDIRHIVYECGITEEREE